MIVLLIIILILITITGAAVYCCVCASAKGDEYYPPTETAEQDETYQAEADTAETTESIVTEELHHE